MEKKLIWNRFLDILGRIQEVITMILAIVLPILVVIQVLLRYVFQVPLMGIEELMLFPIIWLYMIGGSNASRTQNHIECGILTLYVRKSGSRAIFNIVRITISLLVSLWLTYWAYWYFTYSLDVWKYSPLLRLPMFFAESAILVGLVLMTFYTLLELLDVYKKSLSVLSHKNREVI